MRIVDAHHHLWDPGAVDYALLQATGRLAPLAKPFLAETYDAVALEHGIAEAVAVEAASAGADPQAETRWLLDQVAGSTVTRHVVAWAPIEKPDLGAHVDRLLAEDAERIVGVRRAFESVSPGFIGSSDVVSGVREVAARGLVFDLVLFSDRLPEAIELVKRVPEAAFVLDHLGKPPVVGVPPPDWKRDIAVLAGLPNVAAKVSGLITESATGTWDEAMLRPYLDHAVATFGWRRLMFASDWPICELAGGYRRWLDAVMAIAGSATADDRRAFFSGTADSVYGLSAGTPARARRHL